MGYKSCIENKGWQENQERLQKKWAEYRKVKEKNYYKNPKLCEHCNKPIKYSKDIKSKSFCGHSCAASFNNLGTCRIGTPRTIFNCIECGKKLTHQQNKYCSKICWSKGYRKDKIKTWKDGNLKTTGDQIPKFIREYLFEKYDNKCSECGWSKVNMYTNTIPLQVHHIDGNYLNHEENNLHLLCGSCHSLTSTNGSLNKGKGRSHRRIYRAKFNAKIKQIYADVG